MRKKFFLATLTILLALTFVGPASAFAVEASPQSDEQISAHADKYITYYKTIDGKCYYRIWNATDLRWETPWLPCD